MNPKYFMITVVNIINLAVICPDLLAQTVQGRTQANGTEANNVITAVPFLLIVPDARTGAMGEAGVAVLPDGNAMNINPSKLAFLEQSYGFSVSYSPWLKNISSGINLGYFSGFYKVDDRNTIGSSLRYFSVRDVQLIDMNKQDLGTYSPNEFVVDIAFSRKFGEFFSMGTAVRYIRSNLYSGQFTAGQETKPGSALAVDFSAYLKKNTVFFGRDAVLAFGMSITNIGTKMSYSNSGNKYFLPGNLKLGGASTFVINELNQFTVALDFNKLLVPTQPVYDLGGSIVSGDDPDKSLPEGILGSFNDAPGGFKEELKEVAMATGLEYMYNGQFAVRFGYFYESPQKGNRRYFTTGMGLSYQMFTIDLAYLMASTQKSPLANTLRFTLLFNVDRKVK